ncbi:hypothetical protein J3998_00005, partial [Thiomicrorhabdus sp. 6S2-11]
MAKVIGTIQSTVGEVKAVDTVSGTERVLFKGAIVYEGETVVTGVDGKTTMALNDGSLTTLGSANGMLLNEDMFTPTQDIDASSSIAALQRAIFEGNGEIDLEATASGGETSGSIGSGVAMERLGYEGEVSNQFATNTQGIAGYAFQDVASTGGGSGDVTIVNNITEITQPIIEVIEPVADIVEDVVEDVKDIVDDVVDVIDDTSTTLLGPEGEVDQVIDQITDIVDDTLGTNLGELDEPVDEVTTTIDELIDGVLAGEPDIAETVNSLLGEEGDVDQVVDGATTVLDDILGTDLGALDEPVDEVTNTIDELIDGVLAGNPDLGGTVNSLLGGEAEEGTSGDVDKVVAAVTDIVDGTLGTNLSELDDPVNEVTTTVDELVNGVLAGDLDLGGTVNSLLGGEAEEGTSGDVDKVVAAVTDIVDGTLGTDLSALDNPVNEVTTTVDELVNGVLAGDLDLGGTVNSLLGGEAEEGTSGDVDEVVAAVTDIVDGTLGTNLSALDNPVNEVTTTVDELVNGVL